MTTESEGRPARAQDSFGPNAEKYIKSASHANPADLQRLVDSVRPSGGRLLDLATGAGHCGLAFAPHVDEVVLADLTPEMLDVAARQAAERGYDHVSTSEVEATALPYQDGEFDYVTCRIAAHHFPDQPAAIAEMYRVLKPGGTLVLVDNVVPDDPEAADFVNRFEIIRDPSHAYCYSDSEMRGILADSGFELTDTSVRRKRMDFRDWTDRLNVSAGDVARLETMLDEADGPARDSLSPRTENGRRYFDLVEITWLARRPVGAG